MRTTEGLWCPDRAPGDPAPDPETVAGGVDRTGWRRTGRPPRITVTPSVLGGYAPGTEPPWTRDYTLEDGVLKEADS